MFMCLGVFFLVSLDVTARWLLESYSLMQFIFLRCSFSVVLILMFAAARGKLGGLHTSRYGWHFARSVLMAGAMFSFFHALRFVPLADIVVFVFAAPLIVTLMSQPFLGEAVGPWRWGAVIVGFCGVLVVLRPGVGEVHPAAMFALLAAVAYAGVALTARKLASESNLSLSIYTFAVPLAVSGFLFAPGWQPPGAVDWLLFVVSGAFGGLGIVFLHAAYQRAPVAVIVPFEYTALIWAAGAGFLFWGEVPDRYTWFGAAIIVSSGLFILWRETLAPPPHDVAPPNFPLQEASGLPPDPPADDAAARGRSGDL